MGDGSLFLPNSDGNPRYEAPHPDLNTGGRAGHSLASQYFEGKVRFVFEERLGVPDVTLKEYVSSLLLRFVRSEAFFSGRMDRRDHMENIATLTRRAEASEGTVKRSRLCHIGDYGLFMVGICQEALRDAYSIFHRTAQDAYYFASVIPGHQSEVPSDTLHKIADNFGLCTYALEEVRKAFPDDRRELLWPRDNLPAARAN